MSRALRSALFAGKLLIGPFGKGCCRSRRSFHIDFRMSDDATRNRVREFPAMAFRILMCSYAAQEWYPKRTPWEARSEIVRRAIEYLQKRRELNFTTTYFKTGYKALNR